MVDRDKTREELINELQQLKQENSELKLDNDTFRKKITNCEAIFESSPVAMFIIDETTNIVMVNLAAVKLCGGSEDEILQHRPGNALRCVHSVKDSRGCGYSPDCKTCEVRNAIESLIANGGTISGAELELVLNHGDGPQSVWMNVGIEPLMKDGQKHWCIAMNDITEKKKTEEQLKESQAQLKSIIDSTTEMIWSVDSANLGLFTYNQVFSDFYLKSLGIQVKKGMRPEEMLPNNDLVDYWYGIYQKGMEGKSFETEYQMNTANRTLKLTINPILNDDILTGLSVFAKDVTAQNKTEEKIRLSEEKFRAAFMTIKDGFYIGTLNEGVIIEVNPGFENIFQYTPEESLGKTSAELSLWAIPDDREVMVKQLKKHGYCNNLETIGRKKNGDLFHVSITTSILNVDSGPHIVGVIRDISDRKQSEELIKERDRLLTESQRIAGLGTYSFDLATGVFSTSKIMDEIFGIDQTYDHSFNGWLAMIHPDDRSMMADYLTNEVISKKQPCNKEFRIVRQNDHATRWLYALGNLEYNQQGQTIKLVGTSQDITEQKEAERALKEKEEEYRTLVENLSAGIIVHDASSAIILSNITANQILGLTDDQMKGKSAIDPNWGFVKEDLSVMSVEDYPANKVLASGKPLKDYIVGISGSDLDKINWGICNGYPMFDQNGKIKSVVITFADITSRKKAEIEVIQAKEKTEESEYRLKLATSAAGLGIWDWNLKTNVMIWDDRMFELYGITRATFPNNIDAWTNGLHPDDKQRALDECKAALNGEGDFNTSFRVVHPDGTVLYLKANGSVLRNENGKPIRMIGINRDITERRLAAIQLQIEKEKAEQSETFLTAIIENQPGLIWLKDVTGKFLKTNTKFLNSCGLSSPEQLYLKTDFDIWPQKLAEKYTTDDLQVIQSKKSLIVEEQIINKGIEKCFETFKTPIVDDKGNFIGTTGFSIEITERKKAEFEIIAAKERAEESDRLKSAFLANMSHEIRTPLNSIIGFSDLLLDPDFDLSEKTEFIKLIHKGGNNLLAIINDIIDISKIETGQLIINKKQFSVEKLINEIVEENSLKAIEKGVDLRINFADQGKSITMESDPNRLKQILTNFVNNSIKFTENGYVEIGFSETNSTVQIYVKDTGIGIPKEYHEQIFDRFRQVESAHTRKYGGNGLGLAISKQLADLLGYKIWLESEHGKGSIFYLSIPKNID